MLCFAMRQAWCRRLPRRRNKKGVSVCGDWDRGCNEAAAGYRTAARNICEFTAQVRVYLFSRRSCSSLRTCGARHIESQHKWRRSERWKWMLGMGAREQRASSISR